MDGAVRGTFLAGHTTLGGYRSSGVAHCEFENLIAATVIEGGLMSSKARGWSSTTQHFRCSGAPWGLEGVDRL